MYFEQLKKRFDVAKKKDQIYIFSKHEDNFKKVVEAFTVYGINTEITYVTPTDALKIINEQTSPKTWFLIDSTCYKKEEINQFAMMLRGRFQSMLLGEVNTLDALWSAKEQGYSEYFILHADSAHLINAVLKGAGYIRSRTSRIIGICNTTPDISISYKTFHDLKNSQLMRAYSSLYINCDIANIYYDSVLGVRANQQIISHITRDNEELDAISSRKLISKFDDHFDYVSFNLVMHDSEVKDFEEIIKGIDVFIDSVSDVYGFIFINIPYYLLSSVNGVNMINNSDVRVLLTNGQIESVYNLNFLKNQIGFKKDGNSKTSDKLICIRGVDDFSAFRITDAEIKSKLGIKIDYSTKLSQKRSFLGAFTKKASDNIIDIIFR